MAESKEKVWTRICHAEQWPTLASGYMLDWDGVPYNQEQQKGAQEMTMSLGP